MNQKEQLLSEIRDLYGKLSWFNALEMKARFKERFSDYKSSEIHFIEYIGKHGDANVTKLAESFYMTRGAISKMSKKLIQKGAIESYQKPDNKKEIYFRLTKEGREIYEIHETLHHEFEVRDKVVYEQVTEAQFQIMLDFIKRYNDHLDTEIKKAGVDIK